MSSSSASSPPAPAGFPALAPSGDGLDARLVVGGDRASRLRALAAALSESRGPNDTVVIDSHPAWWAFGRDPSAEIAANATLVLLDVASAFPAHQRGGTRLVLTQSLFSLPHWLRGLQQRGVPALMMEADGADLARVAPEAFEGQGGWAHVHVESMSGSSPRPDGDAVPPALAGPDADFLRSASKGDTDDLAARLAMAYAETTGLARLERCRELADAHSSSAVAQLALASACMELTALDAAQSALDKAREAAPEWGAVDYEQGKLYVRTEHLDLAVLAFERAQARLPYFVPALVNLSAALGETGQAARAAETLELAAALDPRNVQVLNNLGVTLRDAGRLDEAATMFRRASLVAPGFVFAHYNLGHTLFLAGRFDEAVAAYESGQARDPQRNPVQAGRLGFCRLAVGDAPRGLREVGEAIERLPAERRHELVAEAIEVESALRMLNPSLPGLDTLRELLSAVREDSGEPS